MLLARVPDAEAAAEVEHLRRPAQLDSARAQNATQPVDGDEALLDAASCEPTWKWMPATSSPSSRASAIAASAASGGEAELRPSCAGVDRLVRDRLDARREPHEHALDAGGGGALGLVGRVEHDGRVRPRRGAQLLVGLVVAVEEDPLAVEPGLARERELAERRDVGADALLARGCAGARRSRTPSCRRRSARRARPPRYARACARIVSSQ